MIAILKHFKSSISKILEDSNVSAWKNFDATLDILSAEKWENHALLGDTLASKIVKLNVTISVNKNMKENIPEASIRNTGLEKLLETVEGIIIDLEEFKKN